MAARWRWWGSNISARRRNQARKRSQPQTRSNMVPSDNGTAAEPCTYRPGIVYQFDCSVQLHWAEGMLVTASCCS